MLTTYSLGYAALKKRERIGAAGSIDEFVEKTVTENRLQQGIDKLREKGLEVDSKNTGEYIKWIMGDVFKEELDTLVGSDLTTKDVSSKMAVKARNFFLQYIEQ